MPHVELPGVQLWYNDGGGYYFTLAWDTNRYLNIYTNTAGGALGYVPNLPQSGIAGDPADRVVINWLSFGRGSAGGQPYNWCRTCTHEVGHYLGLGTGPNANNVMGVDSNNDGIDEIGKGRHERFIVGWDRFERRIAHKRMQVAAE